MPIFPLKPYTLAEFELRYSVPICPNRQHTRTKQDSQPWTTRVLTSPSAKLFISNLGRARSCYQRCPRLDLRR
jgi:hypothetical protein